MASELRVDQLKYTAAGSSTTPNISLNTDGSVTMGGDLDIGSNDLLVNGQPFSTLPTQVASGDGATIGAVLKSDGTNAYWEIIVNFEEGFAITRGYPAAGYQSSSSWKNVNRLQHSTFTITNLGDLITYSDAYTAGAQDTNMRAYIYCTGDNWNTNSANVSTFSMVTETNAGTAANNIESITEADSVCIDNGTDFTYDAATLNGFLDKASDPLPTRQVMAWCEESNKGVFSILIADLFPFLKMNQLPLFMLEEQVMIHLTFQPKVAGGLAAADSTRVSTTLGDVGDADATLVRDECKMVADYIFYPQEMMEQYAQANRNMSFNYVDYQFVKRTVPSAEFAGQLIQNVGGAGRIVNKVCVQVENKKPADQGLINNYGSDTPLITATGNGTITTNLRYNDLFLFPIDVTNSARQFHNILMTEGRMPHVSRDIYSGQGQLAKEADFGAFEDYPMGSAYGGGSSALNCDIRSRANWHCYRLNRQERVNSRGIEIYDKRETMSGSSTMRAWIQVVRMAQLVDGKIEVMYA